TASIEAPYMGRDIRVADRIFDKGLWDFSVVSLLLGWSNGKEVMVDNRYLKANYPLLVRLSTYDTHSSLRDTIKLEK
ncbi:hypothetical protein Tco_1356510, partial [Tanacetum coccineum]